ncbi:hypothetical protein K502DRAFT_322589 [Neoconidiobolus thromboides FSU 785]|nr:hypothetical protein K502DRAFT_322589 [Neoconidiobolus thromboides FSU 785]
MEINDLVQEYDILSELFLLKEYDLVWQGSISMIMKILALKSPIDEQQWLLQEFYSQPIQQEVKNHFLLFGNLWSLLLNIITKVDSEAKEKEYDLKMDLSDDAMFKLKILILNMDKTILDFIKLFNLTFYPSPYSKPMDIMLGVSLVAIHKHQYKVLYDFIMEYKQNIPKDLLMDEEYIKNYTSIMDLFYCHCLIGLGKQKQIPELLGKDDILTISTKQDIMQCIEAANHHYENQSVASSTTFVNEEIKPIPSEKGEVKVVRNWLHYIKNINKAHYSLIAFVMFIILAKKYAWNNPAFKRVKVWIINLFLSIKPAFSN